MKRRAPPQAPLRYFCGADHGPLAVPAYARKPSEGCILAVHLGWPTRHRLAPGPGKCCGSCASHPGGQVTASDDCPACRACCHDRALGVARTGRGGVEAVGALTSVPACRGARSRSGPGAAAWASNRNRRSWFRAIYSCANSQSQNCRMARRGLFLTVKIW